MSSYVSVISFPSYGEDIYAGMLLTLAPLVLIIDATFEPIKLVAVTLTSIS